MKHYYLAAALPLILWSCSDSATKLADNQAQTVNGIVEGELNDGIVIYRGVPFAAAPVGDLRWREPQPVESWDGVRTCLEFGDDPMQPNLFGDMNFLAKGRSEDCLYLNIWAPVNAAKAPVLIYFNGGGLMCGSGSEPRYAGDSLAHHGIVSITANYREGVFGFLAHPELSARSEHKTSGNYGALDQVAAIQWVKDNIAGFGGDPDHITIVGESAGSFSTSMLMASPLSRGNLAGVMGSSGAELRPSTALTLAQGEAAGQALVEKTGYTIEQLLNMSADSVQAILPPTGMSNFLVDGYLLDATVDEIFEQGKQAQVPLLVGWNSMEAHPSQALAGQAPTYRNFLTAMQGRFGDRTIEVLDAFGVKTDADVMGWGAIELSGALFTAFPTWKWADYHQQTSQQPVYRYHYDHARPAMAIEGKVAGLAGGVKDADDEDAIAAPEAPANQIVGAVHSADIEYAMGNLATNKVFAWNEDDYKVQETFMNYYINFIKTGNPNGEGLPQWDAINGKEVAPVMHIDVESAQTTDAQMEAAYKLLDAVLK